MVHLLREVDADQILIPFRGRLAIASESQAWISVSNKSFLGNLLGKENPSDRLFGSIAAEAISVMNGVDIIRTHNVEATKDVITIASKLSKRYKGL